ncbi:MAG: class II fructose-bisphosphate aldolase [Candidatus Bathyarchaeia archaeon]
MVASDLARLLRDAQAGGYAIGYFEVWNLESTRALVEVAEEERAPLIVGFNGGLLGECDGLEYYAALARAAVDKARVPAVSLLNEPADLRQVMQGLRLGFMAVMVDFSEHPFRRNVDLTRRVVEVCHSMGVTVEAQLDRIPSAEGGSPPRNMDKYLTDPDRAAKFLEETGVDALSVSVGHVHGLYKDKPRLDLERIRRLRGLGVPLVLHGGTGVSDDDAGEAVRAGIAKINLGYELRRSFLRGVREGLEEMPEAYPEKIFKRGERSFKETVRRKMRVYGCVNRV